MTFDSAAFDQWLTTEPTELCMHAESECIDLACECDCEHCEEFKANYAFDPAWGGTEVSERGVIHTTNAVSAHPNLPELPEAEDASSANRGWIRARRENFKMGINGLYGKGKVT